MEKIGREATIDWIFGEWGKGKNQKLETHMLTSSSYLLFFFFQWQQPLPFLSMYVNVIYSIQYICMYDIINYSVSLYVMLHP